MLLCDTPGQARWRVELAGRYYYSASGVKFGSPETACGGADYELDPHSHPPPPNPRQCCHDLEQQPQQQQQRSTNTGFVIRGVIHSDLDLDLGAEFARMCSVIAPGCPGVGPMTPPQQQQASTHAGSGSITSERLSPHDLGGPPSAPLTVDLPASPTDNIHIGAANSVVSTHHSYHHNQRNRNLEK